MSECTDVNTLPTEILISIFSLLPAKQLVRARRVCRRWNGIIENLYKKETLWRTFCREDFGNLYEAVNWKARPSVLWYNIYRSLALWPKLDTATVNEDEFAPASTDSEEIKNVCVLRHNIAGVLTHKSIVYYDLLSLQRTDKRNEIIGQFLRYNETEDSVAVITGNLDLYVMRKYMRRPQLEHNDYMRNVKSFLILENELYFVNLTDEIFVCHLNDLQTEYLTKTEEGIITLGHSEGIFYFLTYSRNLYSITGRELELVCCLNRFPNVLTQLRLYNFLGYLDWRAHFQWMYALNHAVPEGPSQDDIVTVRLYGDVVLVGSSLGELRIYHAPCSSGELDIYSAAPIMQYHFMERTDDPDPPMCPIIQIDVLETANGHLVVVAMPKKISILRFTHLNYLEMPYQLLR